MVAEASGAVMVLAVNVRADGATDGDLSGAWQHRYPQAERERSAHQLIEIHAAVDVDDSGRRVDAVDPVQRRHIDDEAAGVLGIVAVRPAEAAGDDAAAKVRRLRVVPLGDLLDRVGDELGVRGRKHFTRGRRSAPPAGESASLRG